MSGRIRSRPVYDSSDNESLPDDPEDLALTEEDQWKIINQTGLFNNTVPPLGPTEERIHVPGEETFNTISFIIPFASLLLMFDILIHQQYGRQLSYAEVWDRMAPGVPILSIIIFYTSRYKQTRWMQASLFVLSCVLGPRLIWSINRASWLVNMKQCPPLATLWIYTIVQLNLLPSVLSLVLVGLWVWWTGMKLI